jgi:hypothetical protein
MQGWGITNSSLKSFPNCSLAGFDTRQIGPRLPAHGGRVPHPPRQPRPDFPITAPSPTPLAQRLTPYGQRPGHLSPGQMPDRPSSAYWAVVRRARYRRVCTAAQMPASSHIGKPQPETSPPDRNYSCQPATRHASHAAHEDTGHRTHLLHYLLTSVTRAHLPFPKERRS